MAGNGAGGFEGAFSGDGGPATQAALSQPYAVAVGLGGSLYIADTNNRRIRKVAPDGIIMTVAGKDSPGMSSSGDGGLATQSTMALPTGLAVVPNGNVYIADRYFSRIRKTSSSLPELAVENMVIASEDGGELYVFTVAGRHLHTLNALTGAVRFQFTYNSGGLLKAITDSDGNVANIERDSSGNPLAIVAPGGQRTTLAVNGAGYLSLVTNPTGEVVQLTYNSGAAEGLLATLTDPRGNVHHYFYDGLGRLIRDENPAGGVTTLARADFPDGHYTVSLTTASGLVTTYEQATEWHLREPRL